MHDIFHTGSTFGVYIDLDSTHVHSSQVGAGARINFLGSVDSNFEIAGFWGGVASVIIVLPNVLFQFVWLLTIFAVVFQEICGGDVAGEVFTICMFD